ncbi:unnamed protein product, partial [Prorocentrum cordatum]
MASRSGRERRASRQDGGELHGEPQPDAGARREEGEQPDARLCLERALLPPGMTFVRAGASVIFFFMLYGFVFSAWYVAVGPLTPHIALVPPDEAGQEEEEQKENRNSLFTCPAVPPAHPGTMLR